jgi:hypothetical protein
MLPADSESHMPGPFGHREVVSWIRSEATGCGQHALGREMLGYWGRQHLMAGSGLSWLSEAPVPQIHPCGRGDGRADSPISDNDGRNDESLATGAIWRRRGIAHG